VPVKQVKQNERCVGESVSAMFTPTCVLAAVGLSGLHELMSRDRTAPDTFRLAWCEFWISANRASTALFHARNLNDFWRDLATFGFIVRA